MAKTSVHIRPANLGKGGGGSNSEGHMFREKWYLEAVEKYPDAAGHFELIEGAETNGYWKNKNYPGGALALLERDKREAAAHAKNGKAPSMKERTRINPKNGREYTVAGWSPIREAVVVVKPDTRMKDLQGLANWFYSKGIVLIAAAIHRDEGHTDLETGEVKINHHAHLLLDYMDHKTGKTVKLSDLDMKQLQTEAAKSLGMERGESKEKTSRRGLAADEYRAKAKADELARLEAENEQRAAQLDADAAALLEQQQNMNQEIDRLNQIIIERRADAQEASNQLDKMKRKKGQIEAEIADLSAKRASLWERVHGKAYAEERAKNEGLRAELEKAQDTAQKWEAQTKKNAEFIHKHYKAPASALEAKEMLCRQCREAGLRVELWSAPDDPHEPIIVSADNLDRYWVYLNRDRAVFQFCQYGKDWTNEGWYKSPQEAKAAYQQKKAAQQPRQAQQHTQEQKKKGGLKI